MDLRDLFKGFSKLPKNEQLVILDKMDKKESKDKSITSLDPNLDPNIEFLKPIIIRLVKKNSKKVKIIRKINKRKSRRKIEILGKVYRFTYNRGKVSQVKEHK